MHVTDKGIEYVKENEYIMIYHHLSGKFAILNPYYYSRLLFFNPIYHETKSKKTILHKKAVQNRKFIKTIQ